MPSDDYAPVGGGALRIKGAKVKKHKKKSKTSSGKTDLEKNLSTGEKASTRAEQREEEEEVADGDEPNSSTNKKHLKEGDGDGDEQEEEEGPQRTERRKTEAEKRFEEARRKKLLELSESANSRPELLKTHKERVEELNTYLSKLSEHHDMPKIGPG